MYIHIRNVRIFMCIEHLHIYVYTYYIYVHTVYVQIFAGFHFCEFANQRVIVKIKTRKQVHTQYKFAAAGHHLRN